MSGWDQRYDIETQPDGRGDAGRPWFMIGVTALAVIAACLVWLWL